MKLTVTLCLSLLVLASFCVYAEGNAKSGQSIYSSRCLGCHALDTNLTGPAHRGVFGRKAGIVPGYQYSVALRNSGLIWNEATLNQWLENPDAMTPGQKMEFRVGRQKDRDDVIAYLKTLTKN